jgi:hypothetical protein
LFYDAKKYLEQAKLEDLHRQMDEVKNKHTYVQRISTLLHCCNMVLEGK